MGDLIDRQAAIDALADMYRAAEKWGCEVTDEMNKARAESCMASLVEMKLRIEKLPSANQWIPCSERLPEEKKLVLCYCRSNIIDVLELCNDVWYHDYCTEYMKGFVLAWMPLPEPWKGEVK